MTAGETASKDWNPEAYARFADLRLRPVHDLVARVGDLPHGKVIDLGCGAGAAADVLADRWPNRKIVGVDSSPAMISRAAATGAYRRCDLADIRGWAPNKPPALIFSNAALQWLDDHAVLLPRLAGFLPPGGVLAVQMPTQYAAPSHRFLRDFAGEMFPDRFDFTDWTPPVATPLEYARLLAPLGQTDIWVTDYVQRLAATEGVHPVRRFTESTTLRPFAEKLTPDELAALGARYEAALAIAYPYEADGTVLFPFRRLFFTLKVA
ncbi:methyltransferase domain-containing protein [Sinirhodobacter populi]|uniref:Methyltransferase domain-containing protein n=1 Tax=Paenirhodobacter populi TaxID=2306993 RepID=A0A443KHP7_9RHOB|nr:methyltransferase domain-containing protein [Sinirhodobacter populi]RWR32269.1 methyltransferase domain-containing protein [Sinirhodobacter populi]